MHSTHHKETYIFSDLTEFLACYRRSEHHHMWILYSLQKSTLMGRQTMMAFVPPHFKNHILKCPSCLDHHEVKCLCELLYQNNADHVEKKKKKRNSVTILQCLQPSLSWTCLKSKNRWEAQSSQQAFFHPHILPVFILVSHLSPVHQSGCVREEWSECCWGKTDRWCLNSDTVASQAFRQMVWWWESRCCEAREVGIAPATLSVRKAVWQWECVLPNKSLVIYCISQNQQWK